MAAKNKNGARISIAWCMVFGYAGTIFYLSSLSQPLPSAISYQDKVIHLLEYALLAILIFRALLISDLRISKKIIVFIAVLAAALYGAGDEWHQSFVPLRSMDMLDFISDFFGSILGVLLYNRLRYGNHKTI